VSPEAKLSGQANSKLRRARSRNSLLAQNSCIYSQSFQKVALDKLPLVLIPPTNRSWFLGQAGTLKTLARDFPQLVIGPYKSIARQTKARTMRLDHSNARYTVNVVQPSSWPATQAKWPRIGQKRCFVKISDKFHFSVTNL
jgi:hypothetical protein